MTKVFLEQLKKAIDANSGQGDLELKDGAVELKSAPRLQTGISKDFKVQFDPNGNAAFHFSQYCPINIKALAWTRCLTRIDTNYPQHFNWNGVHEGAVNSCTIKTNVFSSTSVHSSIPDRDATIHLKATL